MPLVTWETLQIVIVLTLLVGVMVAFIQERVSPDVVKKEVMAAGFKLEGESPLLAHAEDNHTSPVFDGAVRGKTDSFLLKFRKP